ncbi:hypothetical protein ACQZV8_12205 [Magnetococcales bacterium HHB-1]
MNKKILLKEFIEQNLEYIETTRSLWKACIDTQVQSGVRLIDIEWNDYADPCLADDFMEWLGNKIAIRENYTNLKGNRALTHYLIHKFGISIIFTQRDVLDGRATLEQLGFYAIPLSNLILLLAEEVEVDNSHDFFLSIFIRREDRLTFESQYGDKFNKDLDYVIQQEKRADIARQEQDYTEIEKKQEALLKKQLTLQDQQLLKITQSLSSKNTP